MNNIYNEEKSLKRYLKNQMSLNLETIVKFLITGLVGVSLTACGGGGGGSSSSDSKPPVVEPENPNPPTVEEVVVNKINEGHTIVGKDTNVSGEIKGDVNAKNIIGIIAKNSNVESSANISLIGDGSVGIHGTADIITASIRASYSIKNSGKIEISGKNSIGISVENGVVGINNGTIIGTGEGVYQENPDGSILEDSSGSIGVFAKNGSKGINNNDILLEGAYTSGMVAKDKSSVENNGNISLKSKLVEESELYNGEYYKDIVYSTERGLVAENGSIAINNGLITGQGNIRGIEVRNGSTGENNGEIQLESLTQDKKNIIDSEENFVIFQEKGFSKVRGLKAKGKNSIATNNKNIKLSGYAMGIDVDTKAKGINNGNIQLASQEVSSRGYSKGGTPDGQYDWVYKEIGVTYSELIGMLSKDGEIENGKSGIITLDGTGVGMKAISNSVGVNNGNIIAQSKAEVWSDTAYIDEPDPVTGEWLFWAPISGMEADNSEIINNNKIQVINDGQGMKALNNSVATNNGDIIITSKTSNEAGEPIGWNYHVIGMELKDSTGTNNGNIMITGSAEHKGITLNKGANFINKGKIEVETENSFARGISEDTYKAEVLEKEVINDGSIRVFANKIGGEDSNPSLGNAIGVSINRDFINNGDIYTETKGGSAIGIDSRFNERNVINNVIGKVVVVGDNAIGIRANNETYGSSETLGKVSVINDGLISVNGKTGNIEYRSEIVTGIQAFNYNKLSKGLVTNNGKIEVESLDDARGIDSYGNNVVNNGSISVKGNGFDTNGIRIQGLGVIATNNGTINVDGVGAWGMYAGGDGTAINSKDGVINVSVTAEGGMIASGGTAINHGTINIEAGNSNTNIVEVDNNGNQIIKSAMHATNGGTIENYGTINSNGNLTLGSTNGGAYMIGTSEDGSYGKIIAKNISIDGDVVVGSEITKSGFKNEYTMQNVVDAEEITLGDNFNFASNSLLYDAEAVTDRWGNLDATLSRNNKSLSDFTTGYITSTANIFGKYQNEEAFKTLSSDAKEVVKSIDTSSVEAIDRSLNDLTPTIYSNLGRQMLETSETFKEQDMIAINSLGENSYNFTFIGEYQDIDSRDNIEGYKSKLSGFIGAMSFGDGTFGTIGYGYNDIDYKENGKGHIQTIHLGLNRFMKYQGVDFRLGLGGEYNFHENKREMDLVNRRAESDFDSYGVRASGEVSKVFGEKAFVKPYLGFDLAHMKYDSFIESNANSLNATIESENYTSLLPKIGLLVGDRFGGLNLFAGVEYSYELGNMDKEQEFSYEGFSGKGKLPKDDLECGTTGVKAGTSYEVNNFTLGASIGKNFGRRDNSFVNISLGYRF